ncbi:hydroxyisourate hydrolase [Oligoflexus tunisiensis]|uniref:hydroxyisourate hydrolase n=1 Tax=Oligoflexus tunisiensis TaxID=708132 RepID=UPI000AEFE578|nr:hydroxyisourate hydrolase [Oligoflexus tunisiensis]
MGRLTTHVLDTAHGKPAADLAITLYRVRDGQTLEQLSQTRTNQDGRTGEPLLEGPGFQAGTYELVFEVAPYFRKTGARVSDPPFFDRISIRFSIADATSHYHVPLLVSPWSYSTYRGS